MLKRHCARIRGCHCEPKAWQSHRRNRQHVKLLVAALLLGLLFIPASALWATAVDRLSLCNLEGHPGETIEAKITLEGTDPQERSGYWYTHYKEVEGDDDRMDITSWITFEPEHYTIREGETKVFTLKVKIPGDAGPGLWGATSEEAGKAGHSDERRTYIIFKDAITGGNVYSGLLIPLSVKVVGKPSPLAPVINFIKANIMVTVLAIIIVILVVVLVRRTRLRKAS